MDCSLPGSSVHGIFQARVLEWGAIAFSAAERLKMAICSGGKSGNLPVSAFCYSGQLFFFAKRKKGVGFSYSQKCWEATMEPHSRIPKRPCDCSVSAGRGSEIRTCAHCFLLTSLPSPTRPQSQLQGTDGWSRYCQLPGEQCSAASAESRIWLPAAHLPGPARAGHRAVSSASGDLAGRSCSPTCLPPGIKRTGWS